MGFLKDLLIGGAALKALKRSNRPGVFAPPNCTLLGMEHIGFGRRWKIIFIENKNPNFKQSFTIAPGTTGMNHGGNQWKFHWN
jgi:hypothetical protein